MKKFRFQTIHQLSLLLVLAIIITVSSVNYYQSGKAIQLQSNIRDAYGLLVRNAGGLNKKTQATHLFVIKFIGEKRTKNDDIDIRLNELKNILTRGLDDGHINKNAAKSIFINMSRLNKILTALTEENKDYAEGETALELKRLIRSELNQIQISLNRINTKSFLNIKRSSLTLVRSIEDDLNSFSKKEKIEVRDVKFVLLDTLEAFKNLERNSQDIKVIKSDNTINSVNLVSDYVKDYKNYYSIVRTILHSEEDESSEYMQSVAENFENSWLKLQKSASFLNKELIAVLEREINDTRNYLKSSRVNSIIAAVSGIFLVALMMYILNNILTLRINILKLGANKISQGLWSEKIILECDDGFSELAEKFNSMAEELNSRESERLIINSQLESQLKETQENKAELDKAQSLAKMGHWRIELPNKQMCLSKNLSKIYDIPVLMEEHIDFPKFLELLNPDDAKNFNKHINNSIENNVDGKVELTWSKSVKVNEEYFELSWETIIDDENNVIEIRGVSQDITTRKLSEEMIVRQAYYDPLTKLPNRRMLKERLKQAIEDNKKSETLMSVIFIDCDRFKPINDTLGHHIGDELLCSIGDRLKDCLRTTDTICRVSGDEFAILLEDVKHVDEISHVAEKIITSVAEPHQLTNHKVYATVSAGISIYPFDDSNDDDLLIFSDMAMYHSKQNGGNQYHYYNNDMNVNNAKKLSLELDLREAVEKNELELFYQPQNIIRNNNEMVGVEALLRWNHPEKGLISPLDFIPIAEETGLIIKIGEWVIRTACEQAITWKKEGHGDIRIGINLSPRQFNQPGLTHLVHSIIKETGIFPQQVDLEITETVSMKNIETTIQTLKEFKEIGVHISLDDFGTGYSSLSYLQKMPIDTLKIDRTFIKNLHDSDTDQVFVRTIINMAHSLGMEVVAEGVENKEQLAFLDTVNCNIAQGYYFSPPVPVDKLEPFFVTSPENEIKKA